MRKALFFIPLFFSMLFFESCQNRHSEHLSTNKKSPLEMMVDDYVAKTFPNWLDSIRNEDDTLYLHVNFFHYIQDTFSSIRITDSTSAIDVVAYVGGAENYMVYPEYHILPPPPPLSYMPPPSILENDINENSSSIADYDSNEYFDTIAFLNKFLESFIQQITKSEQEIYGKDYIAPTPTFDNDWKKYKYYNDRWNELYNYIDSLNLLDPTLIGYTYFGPIQVIILSQHDVDKSLVEPFLKGINVMDLRPKYIWHKKHEQRIEMFGWGRFNVYSIDSFSKFKQVGDFLID